MPKPPNLGAKRTFPGAEQEKRNQLRFEKEQRIASPYFRKKLPKEAESRSSSAMF
jgi:hypothetical protein